MSELKNNVDECISISSTEDIEPDLKSKITSKETSTRKKSVKTFTKKRSKTKHDSNLKISNFFAEVPRSDTTEIKGKFIQYVHIKQKIAFIIDQLCHEII